MKAQQIVESQVSVIYQPDGPDPKGKELKDLVSFVKDKAKEKRKISVLKMHNGERYEFQP